MFIEYREKLEAMQWTGNNKLEMDEFFKKTNKPNQVEREPSEVNKENQLVIENWWKTSKIFIEIGSWVVIDRIGNWQVYKKEDFGRLFDIRTGLPPNTAIKVD